MVGCANPTTLHEARPPIGTRLVLVVVAEMVPMSAYDAKAFSFDRHRMLPEGIPEAIRAAILAHISASRPRLLDLGAGTGRIGWAFAAAGDDYVGIDLSLGMLREFMRRTGERDIDAPPLVQADGEHMPFPDATFDGVMLIQVFGGMHGWLRLLAEARRVLRTTGALIVGQSVAPAGGIDARMKQHLASLLDEIGVRPDRTNARSDVLRWLESNAAGGNRMVATAWTVERTPRGFLDRHRTGARFSVLPLPAKDDALRKLGTWATKTFGSLDAIFSERHEFELRDFTFHN